MPVASTWFALAVIFLSALPSFAQLAITGDSPVVAALGTKQFAATGGTPPYVWTLRAGSSGSISLSGLYTAASTIPVCNTTAGWSMLPCDHIYNTKIDTLSVNSNNTAWMALVTNVAFTQFPRYSTGFPMNYIDASTASVPIITSYTTVTDGTYQIPPATVVKMEGGYGSRDALSVDHHLFTYRKDTGFWQEFYQYYTTGINGPGGGCAGSNCNSQSTTGTIEAPTGKLPVIFSGTAQTAATDAGGAYLWPLTVRVSEWRRAVEERLTGGALKHAARLTLVNRVGGVGQLGNDTPLWPATARAIGGTSIPYGARVRIKSTEAYPGSNAYCAVEWQRGQEYGYIVLDGSPFPLEVNINADEPIPADLLKCEAEMATYSTFGSKLEFVDESGLNRYPAGDNTQSDAGLIKTGAGVTPDAFAEVVVTDAALNTAVKSIRLHGCAVDVLQYQYVIQAGANPVQILYNTAGCSPSTVNFSLSSAVGSIDSAGLYTAPSTLSGTTPTTLYALLTTAAAGTTAYAEIVILPSALPLRMIFTQGTNYTDPSMNEWIAGGPSASGCGGPLTGTQPWWFLSPNVRTCGNGGSNLTPLNDPVASASSPQGDLLTTIFLAPTKKKLTINGRAWQGVAAPFAPQTLQINGQNLYNNFLTQTIAGGANEPYTLEAPLLIGSDGRVDINWRTNAVTVNGQTNNYSGFFGSLFIEDATATAPYVAIDPFNLPTAPLTATQTFQFYCQLWYLSGTCTWAVTTGPGSIGSSSGLYTAPGTPPSSTTNVCVTATSTSDATKSAQTCFNFAFGTMVITPLNGSQINRQIVQPLAATINGNPYTNVTWSLVTTGGSIAGTNYTPPSKLSSNLSVTIRATSTDDPTKTATSTITVLRDAIPIRWAMAYFPSPTYTDPDTSFVWTAYSQTNFTAVTGNGPFGFWTNDGVCTGASSGMLPVYRGIVYQTNSPPSQMWTSANLPDGTYAVTLGFCANGSTGQNITVQANGAAILNNFVPTNSTTAQSFSANVTTTTGALRLDFFASGAGGGGNPAPNIISWVSIIETPAVYGSSTATKGASFRGASLK